MESRNVDGSRVMVTGGAGFIGSHLVRALVHLGHTVLCFDKLSYAGHRESLDDLANSSKLHWCIEDISDHHAVRSAIHSFAPIAIFHLAAESHVDRSIDGPLVFAQTNTMGTVCLLDASLGYWKGLDAAQRERFRLIQVSTDEVYGELMDESLFDEQSRYDPSSPYSASKAAADHFARSFRRTYGLPVHITNSSNNYGPFQHPEKLIPVIIQRALAGQSIPVYGQGLNVRDWLYVTDHCQALIDVWQKSASGEDYMVGARCALRNLDVVHAVCYLLDSLSPRVAGGSYRDQIQFVKDRPGHDYRYAVDPDKIMSTLGWTPAVSWDDGLRRTVQWYLANPNWPSVSIFESPQGVRREPNHGTERYQT
jgi:dTDP-glucose 4,6-dehydratase